MKKLELKFIFWFALLLCLFSSLPYLVGWLLTPKNMVFMGFVYNPDEQNVYISWQRQAYECSWFISNRYTPESSKGLYFNLFFIILGKLSKLLHLPLIITYHIARLICGFIMIFCIYLLLSIFIDQCQLRREAFLLCSVGSGFGWLFVLFNSPLQTVDFSHSLMMPEAFTFLALHLNPLFCISTALISTCFLLMFLAWRTSKIFYAILAGLCGLLLANIHTYDIITVFLVLICFLIINIATRGLLLIRQLLLFLVCFIIALPALAYQFYVIQADPILKARALTATLSPNILRILFSYGIMILLTPLGIYQILREHRQLVFFIIWMIVTFILMYFPFNAELAAKILPIQRKLSQGLQIPVGVLAALGFHRILGRLHRQTTRDIVFSAVLILSFLSNVFFIKDNVERLLEDPQRQQFKTIMPTYYLTKGELEAMEWLSENSDKDTVVLSTPFTSSYIPAVAGNKVFAGHWAETINYHKKLSLLRSFFSEPSDITWKINLLKAYRIKFLYFSVFERAICEFNLNELNCLEERYRNQDVIIYEVKL